MLPPPLLRPLLLACLLLTAVPASVRAQEGAPGDAPIDAPIDAPMNARDDADDGGWLTIEAPDPGARVALPLVEVRGRATPHGAAANDLVIAIDVSDSVVLPSGWDVDGDGPDGRTEA